MLTIFIKIFFGLHQKKVQTFVNITRMELFTYSSVARGSVRLIHSLLCTSQHVATRSHGSSNQNRLSSQLIILKLDGNNSTALYLNCWTSLNYINLKNIGII